MKRLMFLAVGLCLVVANLFFYQWYDRSHISSDLRRTLEAGCDMHASLDEVDGYTHTARMQLRTKRDREIFEQFEEAWSVLRKGNEFSQEVEAHVNETAREIQLMGRATTLAELNTMRWQIDADMERDRKDCNKSNQNLLEAMKQFRALLKNLDLPIPSSINDPKGSPCK